MQKLKFMQEFTFAISVECLHSNLQAKLLMHEAHMQKLICRIQKTLQVQSSGK